jgi:hypothetical protein
MTLELYTAAAVVETPCSVCHIDFIIYVHLEFGKNEKRTLPFYIYFSIRVV